MKKLLKVVTSSTKKNTWCYRQGYYQIPIKNEKKVFSYGIWFKGVRKPINRTEREKKVKEFLQQF